VPPVLPESVLLAARAALSAEPAQEGQDQAEPAKAPRGQAAQARRVPDSGEPDRQQGSQPGGGDRTAGPGRAGLPRRVPGASDGPKAPARVSPPSLPASLRGRIAAESEDDTQPIPAVPRSPAGYLPSPVLTAPAEAGRQVRERDHARKTSRFGWPDRTGKTGRAGRTARNGAGKTGTVPDTSVLDGPSEDNSVTDDLAEDSTVTISTVTISTVTGSTATRSTVTGSARTDGTVADSTDRDDSVADSYVSDQDSDVRDSAGKDSAAKDSAAKDSAAKGSAANGSATTGSATTGSATTGSATTGSATTGSATTGSATTGSAAGDGDDAPTVVTARLAPPAQDQPPGSAAARPGRVRSGPGHAASPGGRAAARRPEAHPPAPSRPPGPARPRPAARPAARPARPGHDAGPAETARASQDTVSRHDTGPTATGQRRGVKLGVLVSAMVVLVAGVAFAAYQIAGGGSASPGTVPGSGQVSAAAAAAARGSAAAWVNDQVSKSAVVACDPSMCRAVQKLGFPGGHLTELGPSAPYPLSASVVVVTAAVRRQFGSSLAAGYAPGILARFGTGQARVEVRVIYPKGAAAYRAALRGDVSDRQQSARSLLDTSQRISYSPLARRQLISGQVDTRLMIAIADLASLRPITVKSFTDSGPGTTAGMPLRAADLAETNGAAPSARSAYVHSVLRLLGQETSPYRVANVGLVHTGTRTVLRIEFYAPGPLGLLGNSPVS
jgi:hypothetical protein